MSKKAFKDREATSLGYGIVYHAQCCWEVSCLLYTRARDFKVHLNHSNRNI